MESHQTIYSVRVFDSVDESLMDPTLNVLHVSFDITDAIYFADCFVVYKTGNNVLVSGNNALDGYLIEVSKMETLPVYAVKDECGDLIVVVYKNVLEAVPNTPYDKTGGQCCSFKEVNGQPSCFIISSADSCCISK